MILLCKILVSRIDDIEQHEHLLELGIENAPEPEEYWVDRYVDITNCKLMYPCPVEGEGFGCLSLEYNNEAHYQTNIPFDTFEVFIGKKRDNVLLTYDSQAKAMLFNP